MASVSTPPAVSARTTVSQSVRGWKNIIQLSEYSGCFYHAEAQENIVNTFPWITYVVSIEIGLKLVPAMVLAVLNWKMLKL